MEGGITEVVVQRRWGFHWSREEGVEEEGVWVDQRSALHLQKEVKDQHDQKNLATKPVDSASDLLKI